MIKKYKNTILSDEERKELRTKYISPSMLQMSDTAILLKLLGKEKESDFCSPDMQRGIHQEEQILSMNNKSKNYLTFINTDLNIVFNPDWINITHSEVIEVKSVRQNKPIKYWAQVYRRQCLAYHLATNGGEVRLWIYNDNKHSMEHWQYNFDESEKNDMKLRIKHIQSLVEQYKNEPTPELDKLTKLRDTRLRNTRMINREIKLVEALVLEKEKENE